MSDEINGLVEDLAKVLEPWTAAPATDAATGSRTVVATSGTTVDLNMRRPVEHSADTLYVWPLTRARTPEGAGNPPDERENFSVQLLYTVERDGEEPQTQARRAVSDALDARAALYTGRMRANWSKYANGSPAPWQQASVSAIQHDTVITFGVRGIGLVVSGYRYLN